MPLLAFIPRTFWLTLLALVGLGLALLAHGCHSEQTAELADFKRLNQALNDTLRTSRLTNGQLLHEKESLQGTLAMVDAQANRQSTEVRQLLAQVKVYQKNETKTGKKLIALAQIKQHVGFTKPGPRIAGQISKDTVNTAADSLQAVSFVFVSDSLSFNARVLGVHADTTRAFPTLELMSMKIPNTATVAFAWDEKRPGTPVSFSITNSNPLYRVGSVESFVIPNLRPEVVSPTGWQKFKKGLGVGLRIAVPAALVGFGVGTVFAR